MARRLSPRAVAALDTIWEYIARESGSSEIAKVSFLRWPPEALLGLVRYSTESPFAKVRYPSPRIAE